MLTYLLFFMLFLYANGSGEEQSSTIQLEYEEGNLIQSNSQENQSCWDRTFQLTPSICNSESIENKMWFAWDLMNCVFEDIGKKKYICKSKYIKLCTSKLPDSVLQVYTQYLNSIDEKCFYYDLSKWKANHDNTADTLLKDNEYIKEQLKESSTRQKELHEQHEILLQDNKKFDKKSDAILSAINSTQTRLNELYDEIHILFARTRKDMMDSFSSLSSMLSSLQQRLQDMDSLQRTIMKLYGTTTTWIQMILFTILILIITSIPGLSVARGPLLCCLVLSHAIRLGLRWLFDSKVSDENLQMMEMICVSITILVYGYSTIQRIIDRNANDKLKEQLLEMKKYPSNPYLNQPIQSRLSKDF